MASDDGVTIIHFNDVYHIAERSKEPVGGAARFTTLLRRLVSEAPGGSGMALFSGDVFAPSLTSTITRGRHMVPVLKAMELDAALYGNHDFDFGIETLEAYAADTEIPWLLSNCFVKGTRDGLAGGRKWVVLERGGYKIGIIGLVEAAWMETLTTVDEDDYDFSPFVEEGNALAAQLREEEGVDMVIALTHMRVNNDQAFAAGAVGIDIILGGHDHFYGVETINGIPVVKSGCDFRELSEIRAQRQEDGSWVFQIARHEVTAEIDPHPEVQAMAVEASSKVGAKMEKVVAECEVALDARVEVVRMRESVLGNFVCDVMKTAFNADCAILNSGTLRSNDVYGPGPLKLGDLTNILPMEDMLVVLKITGAQLLEALENGVSKYPSHEGRFPQVSGLSFVFDPEQAEGARVMRVTVAGEDLDPDRDYSCVTKAYLATGKDGYDVFADCEQLVDMEDGAMLPVLVRQRFQVISVLNGFSKATPTDSVHRAAAKFMSLLSPKGEGEHTPHQIGIHPVLEGRILTKADWEATQGFSDALNAAADDDSGDGGAAN